MHYFHENPYEKSITARILEERKASEGHAYVFDRTVFYPGGGGQLPDKGSIQGQEVLRVYEEDGKIYHVLQHPLNCENCIMEIEWERRYLFMRMHTGQHLLSAIFEREFGWKTLSSTIQENYVSIELSTPKITWEEISRAETEAYRIIQENREVKTYWLSAEEAKKLPLRKFVDVGEEVRIVEIKGLDFSLCKGTHVKGTGEIGLIAVYTTEKVRGNARIYFKASEEALNQFQSWRNKIKKTISNLAIEEELFSERLTQIVEEKKMLSRKLKKLEKEIAEEMVRKFVEADTPVLIDEVEFEDEKTIRSIVSSLLRKNKFAIIHSPSRRKVYLSIPDPSLENRVMEVLEKFPHRGGGKNGVLEFMFQDQKNLKEAKNALQSCIFSKVKGGRA